MPFTKFTNLDFDQIKAQIKGYLRANSDFKDFDFEESIFKSPSPSPTSQQPLLALLLVVLSV